MNLFHNSPELTCWANDNDALIPEQWAREGLRVLKNNLVLGALVNRQYSPMVQNFGDLVNVHRPVDFVGRRKTDSDSVSNQDAQVTNVQVPLNQHFHVSFVIKDGEMSKAFKDLVEIYLEPAARELADSIDRVIAGQVVRLAATSDEGNLTEMTSTTADDYILDAMTALDIAKCPKSGRVLVLGPRAQKAVLGTALFVKANERGDGGTALEEAVMGRIYGFDTYMDQNMGYVALGSADYVDGTTDAIEAEGSTVVNTNIAASADITAGCYCWFAGDGKPYRIESIANDPIDLTLTSGMQVGCASGAVARVMKKGEVDLIAGYAAGYTKGIVVDGHNANKGPQAGQWVTFGTGASSHSYTVIEVEEVVSTTESRILLDRPLDTALTDGDSVFYGPVGGYNLAFHKDSLALVSRPLYQIPMETGAKSFVADYEGLAMRITMQYLSGQQGMRVTADLLCGVAPLNTAMACPVYS